MLVQQACKNRTSKPPENRSDELARQLKAQCQGATACNRNKYPEVGDESMKNHILFSFIFASLTFCTAPPISFKRMNEAELAAYNETVEFRHQVYCVTDTRTGSYIRDRVCMTLGELADYNANQMGVLNTATAGQQIFR